MLFEKNCLILHDGKKFQAVCVDKELAIFAPVKKPKDKKCKASLDFEKLFAVSQSVLNGFEYEFIKE